VSFTSFTIPLSDRLAGKQNASATFVFVPTVGGALDPEDSITIRYPASFFLASPSPSVFISGAVAANVTLHSESFVLLTVNSSGIAALTSSAITLIGLTMGDATADVANSVSIITSKVPKSIWCAVDINM
jgi:hypothetical protein